MSPTLTRRTFLAAAAAASCPAFAQRAANPVPVPEVFFSPEISARSITALFDRVAGTITGRTAFKIHGGEAAVNYPLFLALQQHVRDGVFVETNWASDYGGARRHTGTHLEEIRRQGVGAPLDVLDRDEQHYRKIPVPGGRHIKTVEVPEALLTDYGAVAVTTNLKMPSFAGFTGVAKNIGIGLVSPEEKSRVHGAGYQRSNEFFLRMAEAVKGIKAHFGPRLFGISILSDITPTVTCGVTPRTGNIGILAGTDPVACDAAAFDLIWGLSSRQTAALSRNDKLESGYLMLEALQRCGAGSLRYRLTRVS